MPVKRFFALLNAGRELKFQQLNAQYAELTDISIVSNCDAEYHKKLKEYYINKAYPDLYSNQNQPVLDPTDQSTVSMLSNMLGQTDKV